MDYNSIKEQLTEELHETINRTNRIQQALLIIQNLEGSDEPEEAPEQETVRVKPKKHISAASRKKMAKAQKARWAKARALAEGAPVRRNLSPAARRRIAAAQKARWARFRKERDLHLVGKAA